MRYILTLFALVTFTGCVENQSNNKPAVSTIVVSGGLAGKANTQLRGVPTKFMASIGGFSGPSYRVELQSDGIIKYSENDDGFTTPDESVEIALTEHDFRSFLDELNEIELWSWNRRYDNPRIADGTAWKFEIETFGQSVKCSGSNAFPPQKQFDRMLVAVSNLINGRTFQ